MMTIQIDTITNFIQSNLMTKRLFNSSKLRMQLLIANKLMEIIKDYPDQCRVIIDELVSQLSLTQLLEVENLINHNYEEET